MSRLAQRPCDVVSACVVALSIAWSGACSPTPDAPVDEAPKLTGRGLAKAPEWVVAVDLPTGDGSQPMFQDSSFLAIKVSDRHLLTSGDWVVTANERLQEISGIQKPPFIVGILSAGGALDIVEFIHASFIDEDGGQELALLEMDKTDGAVNTLPSAPLVHRSWVEADSESQMNCQPPVLVTGFDRRVARLRGAWSSPFLQQETVLINSREIRRDFNNIWGRGAEAEAEKASLARRAERLWFTPGRDWKERGATKAARLELHDIGGPLLQRIGGHLSVIGIYAAPEPNFPRLFQGPKHSYHEFHRLTQWRMDTIRHAIRVRGSEPGS